MIEQPTIPSASTVLVLNDMININLRTGNPEHDKAIEESGIIANAARLVAALRERGVPIFWIRVERRPDRADAIFPLTDAFLASGRRLPQVVTRGCYEGANVDELPVLPDDHLILKPRINAFIGTDLDLQLRARRVDTVLFGGYSTNMGVESSVRTARDLGYNVVLLRDCCFNVERDLHEWSITRIMPNYARVMSSGQLLDLLA